MADIRVNQCGVSQETYDTVLSWAESINHNTRAYFESSYQPVVLNFAPQITSDIESLAGLLFTPKEKEMMDSTVAFALNYSVAESDILSISSDLSLHVQDEGQFIYSLMTVLSLRVADNLNQTNVERGGDPISPDFHEMTFEVETLIRRGDIFVGAGNIYDQNKRQAVVTGFAYAGTYKTDSNSLIFQQMEGAASVFDMLDRHKMRFSNIVHECYHIYEDLGGSNLTYYESESRIHEIEIKAQLLLEQSARSFFNDGATMMLEEERIMLENLKIENNFKHLECMGYNQSLIDFEKEYWQMKEDVMADWTEELEWELKGLGLGLAKDIYEELLTVRHAHFVLRSAIRATGDKIDKESPDVYDLKYQTEKAETDLNLRRTAFEEAVYETHESGAAARKYIESLGSLMVYARYAEPSLMIKTTEEYLNAFDTLAHALLYQQYLRDGI